MTKPTDADRERAAHAIAELGKLPIEFRSIQADIDALSLIIAAVRAEEREECARLATSCFGAGSHTKPQMVIAAAIRARGKENG